MLELNGAPWARGQAPLLLGHSIGYRCVTVAVTCKLEGLSTRVFLDTGCEVSIVGGELASLLEPRLGSALDSMKLHTRLGTFEGRRFRCSAFFEAESGQSCNIEITLMLCKDWGGPPVLGFNSALDRLRFALDPAGSSLQEPRWFFSPS